MKVIDYLEVVGRASGKELLDRFHANPDPARDELFQLITDKEVSVHTSGFGEKFYRFPYYHTKHEMKVELSAAEKAARHKDRLQGLLAWIRDHPGSDGLTIRAGTKLSTVTFGAWIKELLDDGLVRREKVGVAWKHYAIASSTKKRLT